MRVPARATPPIKAAAVEAIVAAALFASGKLHFTLASRAPASAAVAVATGLGVGVIFFVCLAVARGRLQALRVLRGGLTGPAVVVAAMLAGSAALEEVIWRGGLFAGILSRHSLFLATVLSTLTFTLFHAHMQRRLAALHLVTGSAFALAYYWTGNLLTPVAMHAIFNTLVSFQRIGARSLDPRAADISGETVRRRPTACRLFLPEVPDWRGVPAAELRDVRKSLDGKPVLNGVSLEVEQGEVVALLGPNGAGKSTLLSVLLGRRLPDHGAASLFGAPAHCANSRRDVGVVLQDMGFPATLKVGEVMALAAAHYADPVCGDDLLDYFDLLHLRNRFASRLSGGEKRRVATALAFVGRPWLLVLDEPTTSLDSGMRERLAEAIRLHAHFGGATLVSTHYLHEAEALASSAVVLNAGVITASYSVDELRARLSVMRVSFRTAHPVDIPDALRVERRGQRVDAYVRDADALVRRLVIDGVALSGLAVRQADFEDAVTLDSTRYDDVEYVRA